MRFTRRAPKHGGAIGTLSESVLTNLNALVFVEIVTVKQTYQTVGSPEILQYVTVGSHVPWGRNGSLPGGLVRGALEGRAPSDIHKRQANKR